MRTREERGPLGWLDPNGSMVKALILANVAVFLLDMLSNRNLTTYSPPATGSGLWKKTV